MIKMFYVELYNKEGKLVNEGTMFGNGILDFIKKGITVKPIKEVEIEESWQTELVRIRYKLILEDIVSSDYEQYMIFKNKF